MFYMKLYLKFFLYQFSLKFIYPIGHILYKIWMSKFPEGLFHWIWSFIFLFKVSLFQEKNEVSESQCHFFPEYFRDLSWLSLKNKSLRLLLSGKLGQIPHDRGGRKESDVSTYKSLAPTIEKPVLINKERRFSPWRYQPHADSALKVTVHSA